jgi:hypothetical protein
VWPSEVNYTYMLALAASVPLAAWSSVKVGCWEWLIRVCHGDAELVRDGRHTWVGMLRT